MDLKTKSRFQGCISTPSLWKGNAVSPFKQIELSSSFESYDSSVSFKNRRLGKLVEEFVFQQLKTQHPVSWICDNLQIQKERRTVGELDALYYNEESPIHLEVSYKFYLYDTIESYNSPLAYWIGPNRKDSLLLKLDKLHNRQFPLLHNELTKGYLDAYDVNAASISQELCFKAQLFTPYQSMDVDISPLNSDCIAGSYVSFSSIEILQGFDFFIPEKLDWLVTPNSNVNWTSYASALEDIEVIINDKRSPMVWIKKADHAPEKCFIVFW